jgi:hypothetical protein
MQVGFPGANQLLVFDFWYLRRIFFPGGERVWNIADDAELDQAAAEPEN